MFFVETQNRNEFVVVKGTSTICQEIFCSFLARELGLYTPHVAIIEYMPRNVRHGSDWKQCKQLLTGKLMLKQRDDGRDNGGKIGGGGGGGLSSTVYRRRSAPTEAIVTDTILIAKAEKELNRAFFILMEYVPNAVTGEDGLFVSSSRSQQQQQQQRNDEAAVVLLNDDTWFDIGAMYMFDALINNWDRIPGNMWDNEGNPTNILFSITSGTTGADTGANELPLQPEEQQSPPWLTEERVAKLVLIDQAISPILGTHNLTTYHSRVRHMVGDVLRNRHSAESSETVRLICSYIVDYVGYSRDRVGAHQMQRVMCGLVHMIERIASWDEAKLHELKHRTNGMLRGEDWADVWKEGMNTIDIPFLCSVMHEIKQVHTQQCAPTLTSV